MTQSKLATVEILNNKSLRHEGGCRIDGACATRHHFPRHCVTVSLAQTEKLNKPTETNKKEIKTDFYFYFYLFLTPATYI